MLQMPRSCLYAFVFSLMPEVYDGVWLKMVMVMGMGIGIGLKEIDERENI